MSRCITVDDLVSVRSDFSRTTTLQMEYVVRSECTWSIGLLPESRADESPKNNRIAGNNRKERKRVRVEGGFRRRKGEEKRYIYAENVTNDTLIRMHAWPHG